MSETSIWRWAVTDDLDALFERLLEADTDKLNQIAAELAQQGADDQPTLDQIEQETEAKLRAMKLPEDVMETMIRGFKTSIQEARDEEQAWEDDPVDPDPDGRIGVALASSQMFFDDPYASLEYEEINRQVETLLNAYGAALSKAFGDAGQSLAGYLGFSEDQLWTMEIFEVLMEAGLDAVTRVWVTPDQVHFLSRWQEDKELPIDLEYGRATRGAFEAVKLQVAAVA